MYAYERSEVLEPTTKKAKTPTPILITFIQTFFPLLSFLTLYC